MSDTVRDDGCQVCPLVGPASLYYRVDGDRVVPYVRILDAEKNASTMPVGESLTGDVPGYLAEIERLVTGHPVTKERKDDRFYVRAVQAAVEAARVLRGRLPASRRSA